jgi:hypothetical protein
MSGQDDERYPVDDPLFPAKPSAKFKIFSMHDGRPHTKIAEYETEEELLKHRQRLDRVEAVEVRRREGTKYIPLREYLKALKVKKS